MDRHIKYGYEEFETGKTFFQGRIVLHQGEFYITKFTGTPSFFDLSQFESMHRYRDFIGAKSSQNIPAFVGVTYTNVTEGEMNVRIPTNGTEEIIAISLQSTVTGQDFIGIKRGVTSISGLNSTTVPIGTKVYVNPINGVPTLTKTKRPIGFTLNQSSSATVYIDIRENISNYYGVLLTLDQLASFWANDSDIVFVEENKTFYQFQITSSLAINGFTVLSSAIGGTSRWISIGGTVLNDPVKTKGLSLMVRNQSGITIPKGKVVKVTGYSISNSIPTVEPISSVLDTPYGVIENDIEDNNNGFVIQTGVINFALDTSTSVLGDKFYADNSGNLTLVKTGLAIGIISEVSATPNLIVNMIGHNTVQSYVDLEDMEGASADDNFIAFNSGKESFYRYETNGASLTDDNAFILSTVDGGDTRWIAVGGQFNYGDSKTFGKFVARPNRNTPQYTFESKPEIGISENNNELILSNQEESFKILGNGVASFERGIVLKPFIDSVSTGTLIVTIPEETSHIRFTNPLLERIQDISIPNVVPSQILEITNETGRAIFLNNGNFNVSAYGNAIAIENKQTVQFRRNSANLNWEFLVYKDAKTLEYFYNPNYTTNSYSQNRYNDFSELYNAMVSDEAFTSGAKVHFDFDPTEASALSFEFENDWSRIEIEGKVNANRDGLTDFHIISPSTHRTPFFRSIENIAMLVEGVEQIFTPPSTLVTKTTSLNDLDRVYKHKIKNSKIEFNVKNEPIFEFGNGSLLAMDIENSTFISTYDPPFTDTVAPYHINGENTNQSFLPASAKVRFVGGRIESGVLFGGYGQDGVFPSIILTQGGDIDFTLEDGSVGFEIVDLMVQSYSNSITFSFKDQAKHSITEYLPSENMRSETSLESHIELSQRIIGRFKFATNDPSSPSVSATNNGRKYLVLPTAIGSWAGQEGNFAIHNGTSWEFIETTLDYFGSIAYETDTNTMWAFDGTNWIRQLNKLSNGLITTATTLNRTSLLNFYRVETISGAYSITLPSASSCNGIHLTFKKVTNNANNITLQASGGNLIDGSATLIFNAFNSVERIVSDGNNWNRV